MSVVTLFVFFNVVPSKSGITIEKSQTSPTKKTLFQKPTQDIAELVEVKPEKEAASLELSFAPLLAGSFFLATSEEKIKFTCYMFLQSKILALRSLC